MDSSGSPPQLRCARATSDAIGIVGCVALQFRNASTGARHRRGEGVQFGSRRVGLVTRLDVFPQDIMFEAGVPCGSPTEHQQKEECRQYVSDNVDSRVFWTTKDVSDPGALGGPRWTGPNSGWAFQATHVALVFLLVFRRPYRCSLLWPPQKNSPPGEAHCAGPR